MSSFLYIFQVALYTSLSAAQSLVCVWNSFNSYDHLNGEYTLVPGKTFEGYQYYIKNTTGCPIQYLHNYYDGNFNVWRDYWQIYSSLVDYYIDHVPYCDASPHPSNPTTCVSSGGNWYEWANFQKKRVNVMTVTDGLCPSSNCDRVQLIGSGIQQCDKIFTRNTNYNNVFQNGITYLYFNENTFRWYCSDTLGINECGNDNTITHFYVSSKSDGWNDVTEGYSFQLTLNNNNIATFNCLDTETPTYSPTQITNQPTISPTNPTIIPTLSTNQPSIYPTQFTNHPTYIPTSIPTIIPTSNPTNNPTIYPTYIPSFNPTNIPTYIPTYIPTIIPTYDPTIIPTIIPTKIPSINPTNNPTYIPTNNPTTEPTSLPTIEPTYNPTTYIPTIRIIVPEYTLSPSEQDITKVTVYTNDLYTTIGLNKNGLNNNGGLLSENYIILIIIICSMIGMLLICLIIMCIYIFKKRKNKINKNNMMEMEAVKSVDSTNTTNLSQFALATTPNLNALNEKIGVTHSDKMGEVDLNHITPESFSHITPQIPSNNNNININNNNNNIQTNESMDNDGESDTDELFKENINNMSHVTPGYDNNQNEQHEKDIFDESDHDDDNDYGEMYSKPAPNNNVTSGGYNDQFKD